jgi:hypothetical protein
MAPKSAIIVAIFGAATRLAKSMTTIPSSGNFEIYILLEADGICIICCGVDNNKAELFSPAFSCSLKLVRGMLFGLVPHLF